MNFPRWLRRVNRVFTNRILGLAAPWLYPHAVVHHVGRKSGRAYQTPVVSFGNAERRVIPLTYGRDADWVQNLIAAQSATVVQLLRPYTYRHVRIVDFDEAADRLPWPARVVLGWASLPGYVLLDA